MSIFLKLIPLTIFVIMILLEALVPYSFGGVWMIYIIVTILYWGFLEATNYD